MKKKEPKLQEWQRDIKWITKKFDALGVQNMSREEYIEKIPKEEREYVKYLLHNMEIGNIQKKSDPMIIQFNTDNNVSGSEKSKEPLVLMIEDGLSRFKNQITKVEVHLSDENGDKEGVNDKKCVLEVHIEGMSPIAVTNHADTHELVVSGAIKKLKSSITRKIGKLKVK